MGNFGMRLFLAMLAMAGIFVSLTARADDSQTYNDLIAQARSQLTNSDYPTALQTAQQAVLQDNADYRGKYYAAYALYKQSMYDDAARTAQESLDRAPADQKEGVQKLLDAIASQRDYRQTLKEADDANEAGLINKAATLYTKAWHANTNDQAAALKAAHLWAERLNNAEEAARILHAVLASPRDNGMSDDASKLLLTLQPQLLEVLHKSLVTGRGFLMERKYSEAVAALTNAVEFFPDQTDPHIYLARAQAGLKDFDAMKSELLAAVRAGMSNSGPILSREEFRQQLLNPDFAALMQDIFGPSEAVRIQETLGLWGTLDQNESAYQSAKEAFDSVAQNLDSYETNNLAGMERDLKQIGELIFNGQLTAAAEIFARAAQLYNDDASKAKVKGERKDLQQQLDDLQAKVDALQDKIDKKIEERDNAGKNFIYTPEGQRIQIQADAIRASTGDFQAALNWSSGEVNRALAAQLEPILRDIDKLEAKKNELTEEKIPEVKRQLQNLDGGNN